MRYSFGAPLDQPRLRYLVPSSDKRFRRAAATFGHDFERASDRIDDLIADLEETRDQCEAFAERLDADER